jgi:hypothetical protein
MCNYRYKIKNSPLENTPCIYPDLYLKYADKFPQTNSLPIDNEGYCVFHSKDINWKNKNDFSGRFNELLNALTKTHQIAEKGKLNCNFSGFYLCAESGAFVIDNYLLESHLDFSFCEFENGLRLTNSRLSSIALENSLFHDTLELSNVHFVNNVNCPNSSFDNGVIISNCELTGFSFFNNCTFRNINKNPNCVFSLKDCPSVNYISFEDSTFEIRVACNRVTFNAEVVFDKSIFSDEFYFQQNEINGVVSFKESEFLLSSNLNPIYSSVDFSNLKINENGRLIFKGKRPLEDMVKGELLIGLETTPEGIISFENFNLNKIFPKNKIKLLELEKTGNVEIGKGCRKYYCQTDVITIESSNSNQKLIIDIVTVFCNYFEIQQGYNLGVEIIERTQSHIKYFYFTDETIAKEDFIEKIKQNENGLWKTFSNLTRHSTEIVSKKDIGIKNCLIDIAGLFLKIGNQIEHNSLSDKGLNNIFRSIAIDGNSSIDSQSQLKEIILRWEDFINNPPTIIIKNIETEYNINGNVGQIGNIVQPEIKGEQKNWLKSTVIWVLNNIVLVIVGVVSAIIAALWLKN